MLDIRNTYAGYEATATEDEQGFITLMVYGQNNELIAARCFLHIFMAEERDAVETLNSMPEDNKAIICMALCPVLQCLIATAPRD